VDLRAFGQRKDESHRLTQELSLCTVAALGVEPELAHRSGQRVRAEVVDRRPVRCPIAPCVGWLPGRSCELCGGSNGCAVECHPRRIADRLADRTHQLRLLASTSQSVTLWPAETGTHEYPSGEIASAVGVVTSLAGTSTVFVWPSNRAMPPLPLHQQLPRRIEHDAPR